MDGLSTTGPAVTIGGGPSAGTVTWVALTQAHLDAGTKYTGAADTLKSAAVAAGVLTVTSNVISGTADGHRETSGIGIPILDGLPLFDPALHDVGVYLHDIQTSSLTMALAVALVVSPGASGTGVGVLVTDVVRAHPQTLSASVAAATFTGDAWARFSVPGVDASAIMLSNVERIVGTIRHNQATTSATVDLSGGAASMVLYVQAASYSGAQVEDSTAAAEVWFAAIPKPTFP